MQLRPLSLPADSVAPASGDRARTSARKTTDIPKFLTIVQVAELLAVSTRTVRRWIEAHVREKDPEECTHIKDRIS
jgi:hypothetical protein